MAVARARPASVQVQVIDLRPYAAASRPAARRRTPATDAQGEGTHEPPGWRSSRTGRSPTPDPAVPRNESRAPQHPGPRTERSFAARLRRPRDTQPAAYLPPPLPPGQPIHVQHLLRVDHPDAQPCRLRGETVCPQRRTRIGVRSRPPCLDARRSAEVPLEVDENDGNPAWVKIQQLIYPANSIGSIHDTHSSPGRVPRADARPPRAPEPGEA